MFQNHYPFNNGVYTGEMDFIVDISDDTKNKYFAMIETKKVEQAKYEEQRRQKLKPQAKQTNILPFSCVGVVLCVCFCV